MYIAGLANTGKITFGQTTTTFVDVENEVGGDVTLLSGTFTAYGIVNKGVITVKSGCKVAGKIRCNEGGIIFIEDGVNGTVTVPGGDNCTGSIAGPGAS